MLSKYDQSITPVVDPSLQLLVSDQGVFSFKVHSTNPEKFNIGENACVRQLNDIFKILVNQENMNIPKLKLQPASQLSNLSSEIQISSISANLKTY